MTLHQCREICKTSPRRPPPHTHTHTHSLVSHQLFYSRFKAPSTPPHQSALRICRMYASSLTNRGSGRHQVKTVCHPPVWKPVLTSWPPIFTQILTVCCPLSSSPSTQCLHHRKLLKFADDRTVICLIWDIDESGYRQEVEQLLLWCGQKTGSCSKLELIAPHRCPHHHSQQHCV